MARVMEGQVNQCAGRAGQGVGPECKEVAIRFDEKIGNLLSRRRALAAASYERQRYCQQSEKQAPARKRSEEETI